MVMARGRWCGGSGLDTAGGEGEEVGHGMGLVQRRAHRGKELVQGLGQGKRRGRMWV